MIKLEYQISKSETKECDFFVCRYGCLYRCLVRNNVLRLTIRVSIPFTEMVMCVSYFVLRYSSFLSIFAILNYMVDYSQRSRRRVKNSSVTEFNLRDPKTIFLVSRITKYIFFGLLSLIVIIPLMFLWFSRDLPTPGKLVASNTKNSSGIYDRNGTLLYSVYTSQIFQKLSKKQPSQLKIKTFIRTMVSHRLDMYEYLKIS